VRAREEAETAARIAYETRAEFEKEEAAKAAAKVALKEYLVGNEVRWWWWWWWCHGSMGMAP
jgi:hypothetical protein